MELDQIPGKLGIEGTWEKRADSWWLALPVTQMPEMARLMVDLACRFCTLTARPWLDGELRIDYHWDHEGQILTFVTVTQGLTIPSIVSACPAADWAEREAHEYFAIMFTGRPEIEPLMLRSREHTGIYFADGDSS